MPNTTTSHDIEYVLCGVSFFENLNSNESQGAAPFLRSEESKYRHRHRVAGNNSQSQAQTLNKQKLIMFRCESPKRYSSAERENLLYFVSSISFK